MNKKKMPKELNGLWNMQYKPLENQVMKMLREEGKDKDTFVMQYKKMNWYMKMRVLDRYALSIGLS